MGWNKQNIDCERASFSSEHSTSRHAFACFWGDVRKRYEGKERRRDRNQRHRIERAFRRILAGPFAQRAMPSKSYYSLEINRKLILWQFIASNVLAICELANRFQVDTLLRKCERILRNCFEIPFAERFLFADKYSLKGLMVNFWQYNVFFTVHTNMYSIQLQ